MDLGISIDLLILAVGMFFSAWLGLSAGKDSVTKKHQEDMLDVIDQARKAKSRINDPKFVKRLLQKYGK